MIFTVNSNGRKLAMLLSLYAICMLLLGLSHKPQSYLWTRCDWTCIALTAHTFNQIWVKKSSLYETAKVSKCLIAGIWTESQEEQINTRPKNKLQYVPNELEGKIPKRNTNLEKWHISHRRCWQYGTDYFNRQSDLL